MDRSKLKQEWNKDISKHLVGKTIKEVRYLTEQEEKDMAWYSSSAVIIFTDGTHLIPSADDEGNDAGALFTNIKGLEVIPVI